MSTSDRRSADPLAELIDALLVVAVEALKYSACTAWLLLCVAAACPVPASAVLLTGYARWRSGWVGALVCVGLLALVFAVWRWSMPRRFARYVSTPLRDRVLGWWRYEKGRAALCTAYCLTRAAGDREQAPRRRRVHVSSATDRLLVKLLAGQTTADWTMRSWSQRR